MGGALHRPRRAPALRAARWRSPSCSSWLRAGGCRWPCSSSSAACCSASCPGLPQVRAAAGPRARRDPAAAPLLGGVLHRPARPALEPQARSRCSRSGSSSTTTCVVALVAHDGRSPGCRGAPRSRSARSSRRPMRSPPPTSSAAFNLPRRLVSILEGESLVNDGMALVLYKTAVAAAVAGAFSLWSASWHLVVNVIGGIAVGLAVGYVVRQVRRRIDDTPTEVAIALLSGYLAYLPAAALGVSGVLAAVTIGVYMGWYTPQLTTVETRLSGQRVLGDPRLPRQRPALRARRLPAAPDREPALDHRVADRRRGARHGRGDRHAARLGARSSPTCRAGSSRASANAIPYPPWQWPVVLAWAGVRGAVSLAAALALPDRPAATATRSSSSPSSSSSGRSSARC